MSPTIQHPKPHTTKLRKNHSNDWFGALNQYAKGKPHDMEAIRASIGKALGEKDASMQ